MLGSRVRGLKRAEVKDLILRQVCPAKVLPIKDKFWAAIRGYAAIYEYFPAILHTLGIVLTDRYLRSGFLSAYRGRSLRSLNRIAEDMTYRTFNTARHVTQLPRIKYEYLFIGEIGTRDLEA